MLSHAEKVYVHLCKMAVCCLARKLKESRVIGPDHVIPDPAVTRDSFDRCAIRHSSFECD